MKQQWIVRDILTNTIVEVTNDLRRARRWTKRYYTITPLEV